MNSPPEQVELDFSTEPSPPHNGSNTRSSEAHRLRRKPVTGAQVTVTFYMAAMPAMGMAAVRRWRRSRKAAMALMKARSSFRAAVRSRSRSAAQRGGQTIASKQLSVNATGGM